MIINRLLLIGTSAKDAEIKFYKGINIVSGVSDTGKSYIYQCINYVLGADKKPKDIVEAKKYNNFVLEIKINDEVFTLVRDKDSNIVQLYKNCFELINKDKVVYLKVGVKEKNNKTLNEWLIKKLLNDEVKILMNKSKLRNLTFRDLMHFCCSSEDKIISETSPFFTEEFVNKTLYKSIFKYLISGEDDSKIIPLDVKNIKISKDALLKLLDNQIVDVKREIQQIEEKINNKQKDNDNLQQLNQEINDIGKDINALNISIAKNNSKLDGLNLDRLELISKKDSFVTLRTNYDKEMREAQLINNFANVVNKMPQCKCPLCKQVLKIEDLEDVDIDLINKHNQSIYNKVLGLKTELDKTITEISVKINDCESRIISVKREIEKDRMEIEEKNKLLMFKNDKFLSFKQVQLDKIKLEFLYENLQRLILKKEEIKQIKSNIKNSHSIVEIKNIDKFLNVLQQIINDWTGKVNRVKFDYSNNDIIINGKKRSGFGKGYRAFYSTAMIIALQRYNKLTGIPKPGFVLIDSPLVSLKEQKVTKNDELIDDYMQTNMIEDLIKNKDLGQVIFFENKEFAQYANRVNYIYYSKSNTDGFIPD